jgi:hypothetical protein
MGSRLRALQSGPARIWLAPSFTPPDLDRLLANADAGTPAAVGRAATRVLDLPGCPDRIHLRPMRHGGWLARLWGRRAPRPWRGRRELCVNAELLARGAPVPQPAWLWVRRVPRPGETLLATVHAEGGVDGLTFLSEGPAAAEIAAAAAALGRALRRLHDAGGVHGDLHLKNVLLRRDAAGFDALLVDLDRARVGRPPGPGRRMAELMRLERSLRKHGLTDRVGVRGRAALFRAYHAGDRRLRASLLARLGWERIRIALHRLTW